MEPNQKRKQPKEEKSQGKTVMETDIPGVKVVDGKLEIDEELLFWR